MPTPIRAVLPRDVNVRMSPALALYMLGHQLGRVARFAQPSPEIEELLRRFDVKLLSIEFAEHFDRLEWVLEEHQRCAQGGCPADCRQMLPIVKRRSAKQIDFPDVRCPAATRKRRLERLNRLLAISKMPDGLRTKTFETFEPRSNELRDALDRTRALIETASHGIVLAGPTGIGKTHLAAAAVNRQLADGCEAIFCKVPDLMADLRGGVKTDRTELIVAELRGVRLLVLDDLGAERITEFGLEQLYRIVDGRLPAKKQIVVTTNMLTPKLLADRLGGDHAGLRIVSRLREACTWLSINGRDLRVTDGGKK